MLIRISKVYSHFSGVVAAAAASAFFWLLKIVRLEKNWLIISSVFAVTCSCVWNQDLLAGNAKLMVLVDRRVTTEMESNQRLHWKVKDKQSGENKGFEIFMW